MEASKIFYRRATTDCPVTVYYFSPTHIDRQPQPLHRSNAFMILLMETGSVELYTTGAMTLLSGGDICIVPPRMLHSLRTVDLQTRYTLFCLNPQLFPLPDSHFFTREFWKPLQNGQLRPPQLLRPGQAPHGEILAHMQRLDVEREGTPDYTMELIGIGMGICCALFPYCSRESAPSTTRSDGQTVSDKCIQYIQAHFREHITLEDIADYVHLHPNYLCAIFREHTGKTIFEQLNWKRVHDAAKMLRSTDMPIVEIAERCGFQNPTYFARKFKQIVGCTPTACRNQSRLKK